MKRDLSFSYVNNAENQYIESLYQDYLKDSSSVDETWRRFFEGFEYAQATGGGDQASTATPITSTIEIKGNFSKELKVFELIEAYRDRGHLLADTNPVRERVNRIPDFKIEDYGLSQKDLSEKFSVGAEVGLPGATLKQIVDKLNNLYCKNIAIEFTHIKNLAIRRWLQQTWESRAIDYGMSVEKKTRILTKLNEASVLENFLHTKYVGQKRFSLEGGENTIPAIDAIINKANSYGVDEVVMGMAHRGRLNILANIMRKTYTDIFSEFEGKTIELEEGDGDVKYHLGFSSLHKTPTNEEVVLKLMPNPSHLETVGPVVTGYCRAKADSLYNEDTSKLLPILIHGDAAVAGQGLVYELAQMSKLKGYNVHGVIHFIINNQIGFTTDFWDARSSHYCTQVAHVSDSPVIHVNGDDAEAVVYACELATDFRQKFGEDIYIDMVCYRKYGHNEGDEPKFTQPGLYKAISKHKNPRELYTEHLISSGSIQTEVAKQLQNEFKQMLQDRLNMVKQDEIPYKRQEPENEWKVDMRKSRPEDFFESPATGVKKVTLEQIHKAINELPEGVSPIRKVKKLLEDRDKKFSSGEYDWAMAELAAYGSLLLEGHDVRMSGQDVLRGTFSHRHAGIHDEASSERYIPLDNMDDKQGKMRIFNSLLSEYGVLGFEYGYSLCHPHNLNIWEAQFGDFANGAQIITDQFISSAESKWQRSSGIVLLLPHGYEGQGPEHSSARAERFLQLCAEFNMIVANCTTPASFFHLLRRQLKFPFRKPLVVFTPKSLLRHPECVSPIEDLVDGKFEEFINDDYCVAKDVKRVLLCTGKVYYDLKEKQRNDKRKDVAIIRFEQLHPIPFERFDKAMEKYKGSEVFWVQEEPKNMGYWNYILRKFDYFDLHIISRKSSASTATGYSSIHVQEQAELVEKAFAKDVKKKKK